jgi:hypothetical protein
MTAAAGTPIVVENNAWHKVTLLGKPETGEYILFWNGVQTNAQRANGWHDTPPGNVSGIWFDVAGNGNIMRVANFKVYEAVAADSVTTPTEPPAQPTVAPSATPGAGTTTPAPTPGTGPTAPPVNPPTSDGMSVANVATFGGLFLTAAVVLVVLKRKQVA